MTLQGNEPFYEWPPINCIVINLDELEEDKKAISGQLENRKAIGPVLPSDTLERLRRVVDWFIMENNPRTWRPDAPGRK